jgi:glucose-1-phosphate thymidylyltransferase
VAETARTILPGPRGELEVTDLNRVYLERGELEVVRLGRGVAWLDTGTPRSLMDASQFIQAIEERQGLKVACLEEIAYDSGWIDGRQVAEIAKRMGDSSYGRYLKRFMA